MIEQARGFDVVRIRDGHRVAGVDQAAAEEPLEIRLHGQPFAVIMRTPGADRELAAGFLLAERVIRTADDLGAIEHCTDAAAAGDHPENIINVTLAGAADTLDRVMASRRAITTTSSCGLCGRQTIESLKSDVAPLAVRGPLVTPRVIAALPDRLRASQSTFDRTGGLHAAGLFTPDGMLEAVAEDVGRHNAVDKVIGRMAMMDALPLSARVLFVSGRTSFEIVQKALFAGIPLVASVSAPSSLAIDLAREAGVTLVGFVRGTAFNVYAHPERIA
jgi:FdhD protein